MIFMRIPLKYIYPVMMIVLFVFALSGAAVQIDEYTLKAVYLEHFVTFIEWPGQKEPVKENKSIVIGVYGKTNMLNALQKTYSKKTIGDKKVLVLPLSDLNKTDQCQILFIGNLSEKDLNYTITALRDKPVLMISENKGFALKGVHINFFLLENNVRFEINEKAAIDAGFHISHHLLKLAKVVSTKGTDK